MAQVAEIFAKNLKKLRAERGLSQFELAEKIGVSHATVVAWETSKRWPGLESIKDLAIEFDVTEESFFESDTAKDSYIEQAIETLRNMLKQSDERRARFESIPQDILEGLIAAPPDVLKVVRHALSVARQISMTRATLKKR